MPLVFFLIFASFFFDKEGMGLVRLRGVISFTLFQELGRISRKLFMETIILN